MSVDVWGAQSNEDALLATILVIGNRACFYY